MPRLSNEQLIELCATPYERLSPAQQRSARSYKRKAMDDESLTQEAERLLEDQPQLSVTQAYYSVMQLNKPKAIESGGVPGNRDRPHRGGPAPHGRWTADPDGLARGHRDGASAAAEQMGSSRGSIAVRWNRRDRPRDDAPAGDEPA